MRHELYQFMRDLIALWIGTTETVDEMNYVILLIFWLLIDTDCVFVCFFYSRVSPHSPVFLPDL